MSLTQLFVRNLHGFARVRDGLVVVLLAGQDVGEVDERIDKIAVSVAVRLAIDRERLANRSFRLLQALHAAR